MIALRAHAKVNLLLRVRPRDDTGMHPLYSLFQSVDLADRVAVAVADADADELTVAPEGAVDGERPNLAWSAAVAVRERLADDRRLRLTVEKRIPVAAGLGGGSADAAAALVATAGVLGAGRSLVEALAPPLGADVPFCLTGGTLWMDGHGTDLRPAGLVLDYHLALATAPFPLHTGDVFRRWDELDGPRGVALPGSALPPSLRDLDVANDLEPAARSLRPELADWVAGVGRAWGRRPLMTGSGPTVLGFFAGRDEAEEAAREVIDARFGGGVSPVDRGWDGDPGGTLPPPPWGVV